MAGPVGANTFPGFRRYVIEPARGRILAFLNISLLGQVDTMLGELHDLRFADPERAARVAQAHPDVIVGFKVRLSEMLAGPNGFIGLQRAIEAGEATGLPVMSHIGGTPFDIEEALAIMRPGDIVTHAFTGWRPGVIVGEDGRLVAGAREARERGVRFDVGHGQGSFTWAVAEAALADGFRPDTISTDLHRFNIASPVQDLATTMSKFLHLGLSLDEVVGMVTHGLGDIAGRGRRRSRPAGHRRRGGRHRPAPRGGPGQPQGLGRRDPRGRPPARAGGHPAGRSARPDRAADHDPAGRDQPGLTVSSG